MTSFDAVILAGGRGERMGGLDKASVLFDGTPMLDRVLAATAGATRVVVVGPERPTAQPVRWTREEPPGGGPVAAVAAGLAHVEAPVVVVLAVDLPFVTGEIVTRLIERCSADVDAALVEDEGGARQPLLAAYRVPSLRSRLVHLGDPSGASMRTLTGDMTVVTLSAPHEARDIDTSEDLERAQGSSPRPSG